MNNRPRANTNALRQIKVIIANHVINDKHFLNAYLTSDRLKTTNYRNSLNNTYTLSIHHM